MIEYEITTLQFSGGESLPLEKDSLVLLVGPNSSGKTTALVDIETVLQQPATTGRLVVKAADVRKAGTTAEFRYWIESHFSSAERASGKVYLTKGQTIADGQLDSAWNSKIKALFRFLCHRLNREERLQIVPTVGSVLMLTNHYTLLVLRVQRTRDKTSNLY